MDEKTKIIEHSKEVFIKNGFYKITMEEIARGLRISKKTIYKHFPSKNSLVDAAVKIFQLSVKNKMTKMVNEENNAILKIKALTEIFAELSLKVDEKMLYDLQTHRPDLWDNIEAFRSKLIKNIWEEIIDQGKKEDYIIDKPNEIIITVIYSAIRSVINPTFLLNHNYSINEAFRITFDILIKGLLTPKGLKVYNKIEKDFQNEKK
ncbi:MAG: TetR/AcrR family transcriptional regulator [Melioribacteraceae bacterium]|nr:TetR/AcrR family transcriptional regulator [Melioribacteraceae bacterium]